MTTTAARVDVLTAEIRVLMVGSRQVTLSVYGQLDQVKPAEIDPFGRVAPRDADPDYVYVVGASARDADRGTLVRSRRESMSALIKRADGLRDRADMIGERPDLKHERSELVERADYHDRPEHWKRANAITDRLGQLDVWLRHETRTAEELIAESGATIDAAEDAAQWAALPLIVLAGLR